MVWCRGASPATGSSRRQPCTPTAPARSCGQAVDPGRAHHPESSTVAAAAADGPPLTTPGPAAGTVDADAVDEDDERPPIPWHLWLLLAALAVYLGYRAFQGLEWIFGM